MIVSHKYNLIVAYIIELSEKCNGLHYLQSALDACSGCKMHVAGGHIL